MTDTQKEFPAALPVRQKALIARIARAWAREEGEQDLFDAARPANPACEGGEVYESYMRDAFELLDAAGVADLLTFAETLSRNPPARMSSARNLDAIEAYIAQQMTDIQRINQQLDMWRNGGLQDRDDNWADNARRAADAKAQLVRQAQNLRLKFSRDELFADVVDGRDRQIAQLVQARRDDKRKRHELLTRANEGANAMADFVREHAPNLLDGMNAARDEAQEMFDRRLAEEAAELEAIDRAERGEELEAAL